MTPAAQPTPFAHQEQTAATHTRILYNGKPVFEKPETVSDCEWQLATLDMIRMMRSHAALVAACSAARSLLHKLGGHNHDPEYSELIAALALARPDAT